MLISGCLVWGEIRKFYYPFRSEQLAASLGKQMATDLILMVCENVSRGNESQYSLSLYHLHLFLCLQRLRLFMTALRSPWKFYFPTMI